MCIRDSIYVVRQATQGLANWVKTQGGNQTVAISYDSRIKSDVFAKTAAAVLAANGIKVRIYDALMPVPALSFATRYYDCLLYTSPFSLLKISLHILSRCL